MMEYPSLSFLPLDTYIRALLNDSFLSNSQSTNRTAVKLHLVSSRSIKDNNETTEDGVVLPLDRNSELVIFDPTPIQNGPNKPHLQTLRP